MSYIGSKVPDIERKSVNPFPARPVKIDRMVRVDRTIVAISDKGECFSTGVQKACWYTIRSDMSNTLIGLMKLGVFTKEQVEEHEAYRKKLNDYHSRKSSLPHFRLEAQLLGIELTREQLVILAKIAKEEAP
jgi:hypothetical protein